MEVRRDPVRLFLDELSGQRGFAPLEFLVIRRRGLRHGVRQPHRFGGRLARHGDADEVERRVLLDDESPLELVRAHAEIEPLDDPLGQIPAPDKIQRLWRAVDGEVLGALRAVDEEEPLHRGDGEIRGGVKIPHLGPVGRDRHHDGGEQRGDEKPAPPLQNPVIRPKLHVDRPPYRSNRKMYARPFREPRSSPKPMPPCSGTYTTSPAWRVTFWAASADL